LPKGKVGMSSASVVQFAKERLAKFDEENERIKRDYADVFSSKVHAHEVRLAKYILRNARADHVAYLVGAELELEDEKNAKHAN